jgi:hypothetical protein
MGRRERSIHALNLFPLEFAGTIHLYSILKTDVVHMKRIKVILNEFWNLEQDDPPLRSGMQECKANAVAIFVAGKIETKTLSCRCLKKRRDKRQTSISCHCLFPLRNQHQHRDEAGALFICLVRNVHQGCARVQKNLHDHNVER